MAPLDDRDVRLIVPQIRRRLEYGASASGSSSLYTDDMLKDLAADAANELSLIGGDAFPYEVSVASADASGYPTEYIIEPAPPLAIQTLIALQAAIGQVFNEARGAKVREKITNEGGSWEYERSAAMMRDRLKHLLDDRAAALRIAASANLVLDTFTNIIETRAASVWAEIEPYDTGGT